MDNRWKNLLVIAVILLVVFLIFYVVPSFSQKEISFDDGKEEINVILSEAGYSFSDDPYTEVSVLGKMKSGLKAYKDSLSSYKKSEDRSALEKYIDIQLKVVEGLEIYNAMDEDYIVLLQVEDDFEQTCANISSLRSLADNTDKMGAVSLEIAALFEEFSVLYPEHASEVDMGDFSFSSATSVKATVDDLAQLCSQEGLL